jgi:hypothetical protein
MGADEMSVPSWARRGQKVVCVDDTDLEHRSYQETCPVSGAVYTIREVMPSTRWPGEFVITLVEIVNQPQRYAGGLCECCFRGTRFRPLVTLESDIETHFAQYLKTDHRATEKERA